MKETKSWKSRVRLFITSGFWPRVRARALRTPVFLDSLPRPTGRCAPIPLAHRTLCILRRALQFPSFCEANKKVFLPRAPRGAKGSIVYYIEYHSLCAVIWFGSPHCLSRGKCLPPSVFLFPVCIARQHSFAWAGVVGHWLQIIRQHRNSGALLYTILTLQPRLWDIMSPPLPWQLRWSLRRYKWYIQRNPAKYPSLAKNPPKYTTAYIVQ